MSWQFQAIHDFLPESSTEIELRKVKISLIPSRFTLFWLVQVVLVIPLALCLVQVIHCMSSVPYYPTYNFNCISPVAACAILLPCTE